MASFNQDSDQPYIENFPQLRILLEASIRKESIDTKMALDKIFSPAFEVESQTEDPETRRTIEWLKSFRKALIKERYGLLENILEDLAREEAEFVLISDDLTPIQVQDLPLNVQGFATEKGGKTSHSTICARSRGVPAVTNLPHDLVKNIPPDALVIIDGFRGRVIVDPDQETLKKYRRSKETYDLFMKELANLDRNRPAVTQDGIPIALRANVEASHEVETALKAGANEGIGLFRTEFAFISDQNGKKRSSSPTEEEQFSIYREAVKANSSSDQPIIMRTIDFEDDKKPDYLPLPISTTLLRAPRGVYLCLAYLETNPPGGREQYKVFYDLFREQVRAILRTSHFGKIKIMFPLVLNTGEFRKARKVVTDIMTELKAKNIPFDEGIQIGTMIENPSAAKDEELARAADFASLGTNDLVQFTTGIGRSDPRSANIDLDPKVIAHIEKTIQNFTENGKSVSLCGNMAAEPLKLLYLLGLGLREISVPASSIEMVKHVIRNINIQDCQELVARIPREASPAEKLRLIREYTREKITDGSWGNLEKVKDWLLGD